MVHAEFEAHEYGEGNGQVAASLVIGFAGERQEFEPAVEALSTTGHDMVLYTYPNDVITAGDGEILPNLIRGIGQDFQTKMKDYAVHRHTGVSIGGGIAWNMQKSSPNVMPGLFAAAGADATWLVFRNRIFRAIVKHVWKVDVKKEFLLHGWDEASLRKRWEEAHVPPVTSCALALGGLDYATRYREMMPKIKQLQAQGLDIITIVKYWRGHTGMKKWFINNIPTMIAAADGIIEPR